MNYEKPEMELIKLKKLDIIITSNPSENLKGVVKVGGYARCNVM